MAEQVSEDDLLRQFLAERDFACPACGYNVRDLLSPRCPECGSDLQLTIGLVEPRQGRLIAGLIGLSAGFGLNGLLLIYGLFVVLVRHERPSDLGRFFVINGVGFVALGGGIILWLRNWRRLRLARQVIGRSLAIVCWGLSLADVCIFALYIR